MRNPSSSSSGTSKTPCCSKVGIKRGPWTPEEDEILANYIKREGEGRWRTLPKHAGLLRCGKSCRLRWMNYLRPSVKRGRIAPDEEDLILRLHRLLGNRWSLIAGRIPGRTDNEIKNYWNTHLSKKLISQGIDPRTHKPLNPNPNPTQIVHDRAPISTQDHNPDSLGLKETAGNAIQSGTNLERNLVVNEEDYVENCDEDNMFSSFLDSLINDNMFVNQQQQPNFHPSSAQTFNHATIWETELIRSTIDASSDDQQSALNNQLA
ncbi:hypothetical protein FH972_017664 [Carpinus fangiana]|uniref:Uncharacterized protein n=1 Tax=Carpinus fangiana TaxID=176857 RepID=A0A5N6RML2_9ROSI|nr:hypothetical protein FH972_017664 [Carpinus fangiana]